MEKIKLNTEINFTEEKLMDMLEQILFYENINRCGEEADELIDQAEDYIRNENISPDVQFKLCDYCSDISARASTHAFKVGFKEGVRLLRTLLML